MKTITLIEKWGQNKKGSVIEVDDIRAQYLVDKGIAKLGKVDLDAEDEG